MNSAVQAPGVLPARRVDAAGRVRIDHAAIARLAVPLILTNGIQAVLNLTDMWFIGRLSTNAVAAMGSIYWIMTCAILLFGGVGLAVQTFVAQAFGSRRHARASRALWQAWWACLACVPLFLALAASGRWLLHPFGLDPEVETLALEYWEPRMAGAFLGSMVWAANGFYNGISAVRHTVVIALTTMLANVPANQFFMFELGWGMSGAAWGTNAAQLAGFVVALAIFLRGDIAKRFRSRLVWRPRWRAIQAQLAVGFPIGLMYGADVLGVALMQLMIAQTGAVGAAASQIVIMLTSLAYMPTIGLALVGTTLVGQSIGAGDRDWAARVGGRIVALCAALMGSVGALLALTGPWLLPWFVTSNDADSAKVIALGLLLLWPAAAYQVFDGLYCGASFVLRGAGDTRVPALTALVLSWFFFVPLAHTLVFVGGEGWIDGLPQFGLGALGGWFALMTYCVLLGLSMLWRWRIGAWRRVQLGNA